jgi:DNA-binding CsgD family transcriptional regulator
MRTGLAVSGSPLGTVGIGPLPERVYRYLVREGHARTVEQVAIDLDLSPRTVAGILRALEGKALVERCDSRPPRYAASPPELALEPLLARQRDEVARFRSYARELQRTFSRAAASHHAGELVEVVVGPDRILAYQAHLFHNVRLRFDALTGRAYGDGFRAAGKDAADRGVLGHAVYEAVAGPVMPAPGVEARLTGELPVELTLFDRQVGLIALDPDCAAIIRASPVLDALGALFDGIWVRAVPLVSTMDGSLVEEIDERSRQVLLLMSDGYKDESIARALGLSRRTVQKCVTAVMTDLGARTRFQAALLAHDRGWLD